jgi:hypothetical protein
MSTTARSNHGCQCHHRDQGPGSISCEGNRADAAVKEGGVIHVL